METRFSGFRAFLPTLPLSGSGHNHLLSHYLVRQTAKVLAKIIIEGNQVTPIFYWLPSQMIHKTHEECVTAHALLGLLNFNFYHPDPAPTLMAEAQS